MICRLPSSLGHSALMLYFAVVVVSRKREDYTERLNNVAVIKL